MILGEQKGEFEPGDFSLQKDNRSGAAAPPPGGQSRPDRSARARECFTWNNSL